MQRLVCSASGPGLGMKKPRASNRWFDDCEASAAGVCAQAIRVVFERTGLWATSSMPPCRRWCRSREDLRQRQDHGRGRGGCLG